MDYDNDDLPMGLEYCKKEKYSYIPINESIKTSSLPKNIQILLSRIYDKSDTESESFEFKSPIHKKRTKKKRKLHLQSETFYGFMWEDILGEKQRVYSRRNTKITTRTLESNTENENIKSIDIFKEIEE